MAHPDTPAFALSRRAFLRYSGITAGLLALARLRPPAACAASTVSAAGVQVLTPRDAQIMTAMGERLTFTGDSAMPRFADTHAIATIDRSVLQLDPRTQAQLRWLLRIFEYGPFFLQLEFTTFTAMPPPKQDAYLDGWANGGEGRRLAFRAVKNLAMLGYYSQDDTWKGIHYDGPWLPRPRRSLAAEE
jgi:hypothetical protein